ncbi:MAG TPA: hypothetical protein PLN38_07480 [Chitinophagales bacterium]|nr:hypothetical protein [Chitinophagales bacterium]
MKFSKVTAETLPLDKVPHVRFRTEAIENTKKVIEFLNKRKELTLPSLDAVDDYTKNERLLLLQRTDLELSKLHTDCIQNKNYVDEYAGKLADVINEMDKQFKNLHDSAILVMNSNARVMEIVKTYNEKLFEENWEAAVNFYLQLKDALITKDESPSKPAMKKA